MWTREQLKRNGLIAFERNRWLCVLVCFVTTALGGTAYGLYSVGGSVEVDSSQVQTQIDKFRNQYTPEQLQSILTMVLVALAVSLVSAIAIMILVGNPATVGGCRYFMENRVHKTQLSQMFFGFSSGRYRYTMRTMCRSTLITIAYGLIFIVPGVIKSYSYRMVPYILAESPYIDSKRALQLSEDMMRGHKWESFVFDLSFIGWKLLGVFTMGILTVIHVEPYIHASFAEYYTALKSEAIRKGITQQEELPGIRIEEGFQ